MSGPRSDADMDDLARRNAPVSRTRTRRVWRGRELFTKDVLEFEDADGAQHIELIDSPTCDYGHVTGSNGHEITGKCSLCNRVVCSAAGCSVTCAWGQHTICGAHATRVGEEFYCAKHLAMRGM